MDTPMNTTAPLADSSDRMRQLEARLEQLSAEVEHLRAERDEEPRARSLSRRGLIAAAAGGAAAMVVGQATPAAATQGLAVLAGINPNTATGTTNVTTTGAAATGLHGKASHTTSATNGVWGQVASPLGTAVNAQNTATTGAAYGVHAISSSTTGRAVFGHASAASGVCYGVYGQAPATGFAVFALGRLKSTGRTYVGAPNSAPVDADIGAAGISFYLVEASNQLKIRVKYTGGVLKTATIGLL